MKTIPGYRIEESKEGSSCKLCDFKDRRFDKTPCNECEGSPIEGNFNKYYKKTGKHTISPEAFLTLKRVLEAWRADGMCREGGYRIFGIIDGDFRIEIVQDSTWTIEIKEHGSEKLLTELKLGFDQPEASEFLSSGTFEY